MYSEKGASSLPVEFDRMRVMREGKKILEVPHDHQGRGFVSFKVREGNYWIEVDVGNQTVRSDIKACKFTNYYMDFEILTKDGEKIENGVENIITDDFQFRVSNPSKNNTIFDILIATKNYTKIFEIAGYLTE